MVIEITQSVYILRLVYSATVTMMFLFIACSSQLVVSCMQIDRSTLNSAHSRSHI